MRGEKNRPERVRENEVVRQNREEIRTKKTNQMGQTKLGGKKDQKKSDTTGGETDQKMTKQGRQTNQKESDKTGREK